jgi:hypothetical protein
MDAEPDNDFSTRTLEGMFRQTVPRTIRIEADREPPDWRWPEARAERAPVFEDLKSTDRLRERERESFHSAPIHTERNDLLEFLDDRCGACPLVVTSPAPPAKSHEYLRDPSIADAICDRVLHTPTASC